MTKKIKLLVITQSFPTKFNPIATVFILNQLKELKKYCDIKVLYPFLYSPPIKFLNPYYKYSTMPKKETIEGIEVYHPKYPMIPRAEVFNKLLNTFLFIESFFCYNLSKSTAVKIAEEWKPDIIHLHGFNGDGMLGIHLKKKYNIPLLMTVWGRDVNRFSKQFGTKYHARNTYNNVDMIVCQSHFLKNELEKLDVHAPKEVITTGGLTSIFKPKDRLQTRKKLGIPTDRKIILFTGHLVDRKGPDYLIEAMRDVVKQEKDVLLLMIGEGYMRKPIEDMIEKYNLKHNVKLIGTMPNKDVADYMAAVDLVVLPSNSEGLPIVLCEALACGTPIVATAVSGTPELVTEDVGYLVEARNPKDIGEKLVLALNKKWDEKKLLARGQEFSVANSAERLVKVYKKLIDKNI